jgi:hypothetical protein
MSHLPHEIETLDLSMIRMKLLSPEGPGWSEDLVDCAIREYRRYLAMCKLHPEAQPVPSKIIDEVQ